MDSETIPPGRTGHVAVSFENYMFVWGGYKENPGSILNSYFDGDEIWIFSSLSEKWYLKKSPSIGAPPGMSGSAGVVIDDALYLFGGYGLYNQGCTNSLFRLNLKTFVWENLSPKGCVPAPVDKTVGWQHNGKLYIFGGFGSPDDGEGPEFQFIFYHLLWRGWTNQFFEYDPETNSWRIPTSFGSLPCARAAHAATKIQNKVFIFGGRHNTYRLNDLHCFDMTTMTWSGEIEVNTGPLPEGRSWHSLTAVNHNLILYGGFSQHNVALSDCWIFDTQKVIWISLELPFEKPRLWHAACLSTFNEVLIYGGCTSNILDHSRTPEQSSDIIMISISPRSLFRLCLDNLMKSPQLKPYWSSLPYNIQSILYMRLGNIICSSIDGS